MKEGSEWENDCGFRVTLIKVHGDIVELSYQDTVVYVPMEYFLKTFKRVPVIKK